MDILKKSILPLFFFILTFQIVSMEENFSDFDSDVHARVVFSESSFSDIANPFSPIMHDEKLSCSVATILFYQARIMEMLFAYSVEADHIGGSSLAWGKLIFNVYEALQKEIENSDPRVLESLRVMNGIVASYDEVSYTQIEPFLELYYQLSLLCRSIFTVQESVLQKVNETQKLVAVCRLKKQSSEWIENVAHLLWEVKNDYKDVAERDDRFVSNFCVFSSEHLQEEMYQLMQGNTVDLATIFTNQMLKQLEKEKAIAPLKRSIKVKTTELIELLKEEKRVRDKVSTIVDRLSDLGISKDFSAVLLDGYEDAWQTKKLCNRWYQELLNGNKCYFTDNGKKYLLPKQLDIRVLLTSKKDDFKVDAMIEKFIQLQQALTVYISSDEALHRELLRQGVLEKIGDEEQLDQDIKDVETKIAQLKNDKKKDQILMTALELDLKNLKKEKALLAKKSNYLENAFVSFQNRYLVRCFNRIEEVVQQLKDEDQDFFDHVSQFFDGYNFFIETDPSGCLVVLYDFVDDTLHAAIDKYSLKVIPKCMFLYFLRLAAGVCNKKVSFSLLTFSLTKIKEEIGEFIKELLFNVQQIKPDKEQKKKPQKKKGKKKGVAVKAPEKEPEIKSEESLSEVEGFVSSSDSKWTAPEKKENKRENKKYSLGEFLNKLQEATNSFVPIVFVRFHDPEDRYVVLKNDRGIGSNESMNIVLYNDMVDKNNIDLLPYDIVFDDKWLSKKDDHLGTNWDKYHSFTDSIEKCYLHYGVMVKNGDKLANQLGISFKNNNDYGIVIPAKIAGKFFDPMNALQVKLSKQNKGYFVYLINGQTKKCFHRFFHKS